MDAITLLKNDHKDLEQLFKRFEKAGDRAYVEKRKIVDKIIEDLAVHAAIEEQVFYPVSRATVPDTEDVALESLEEHHVVKVLLAELEGMDAEDERFDAKVSVLMETVRHHVEEEESEFFPMVRDELGRNALNDIGEALENAKTIAPTRPHPNAPDTPPANLVGNPGAGVVDRVRDTVSGVAQGGVTVLNDLIATVLRRQRSAPSPTGSSTARKTASKVREEVSEATKAVIDLVKETGEDVIDAAEDAAEEAKAGAQRTARTAKRTGKQTARTAVAGAKGTATSTRRSARTAKSSAKRAATSTGRAASRAGKQTVGEAKRSAEKTADAASG